MNPDWITSFEALKSVYSDDAYSNIAVNEAVSRHKGCRDGFVRNMVKGTLRETILLDHFIDKLASGGIRKVKNNTLIVLRMGIYAIRSLDSVPDYAAVNEAVSLARKTVRGTEGFVNAILRSYLRRSDELEPDGPALKYSFTRDMTDMIFSQYGDEGEHILRGLNNPPAVMLRTNTLKTTREELGELLREEGIDIAFDERCSRALRAEGSGILNSRLYREGYYTVQGISSMMAVEALGSVKGSNVLDMCAAPGGKATMMAEMMENDGNITACDIHRHRIDLIEASSARLGIDIIKTRLLNGTCYDESLESRYDFVLADVPCSGLGVIGNKPEIKIRADMDSWPGLIEIQKEILRNAARYAVPGGKICYSTCTLNRNENEKVIETVANELRYLHIIEMKTILPYNNLVGFFYCIIDKNV